ncbi:MAG: serine hydrolase domain-containing protein, partial [Bacteroidales bacterium]
ANNCIPKQLAMAPKDIRTNIENAFREQVQKDERVRNAYLLVHSDKLEINLNVAEGKTGDIPASPEQPLHLASVGKLFTATLISILYDQGKLDFKDPIHKYLDKGIMEGLHVYKGRDYSADIRIRHLLMQTSGLFDVFFNLWEKLREDPDFPIETREAVQWGKANLKPVSPPGKKHHYTDTNYYLLGFIIEKITGMKFHEAMHQYIFDPLGMEHAFCYGFSRPKKESPHPMAGLYIRNTNFLSVKGVHLIDYAGGSITAPLSEYLAFMKALVNGAIINRETLNIMLSDYVNMGFPSIAFNYGYSIWKMKTIPVLMPEKTYSWGCVGVTGAFMFYHPLTESFIIGSFNDFAYRGKALDFMARKVIKQLLKLQQ